MTTITDAEVEYYAVQAALLDPRGYAMAATTSGDLDVVVPPGRASVRGDRWAKARRCENVATGRRVVARGS